MCTDASRGAAKGIHVSNKANALQGVDSHFQKKWLPLNNSIMGSMLQQAHESRLHIGEGRYSVELLRSSSADLAIDAKQKCNVSLENA